MSGEYAFNYSQNENKWTENGVLSSEKNTSNGVIVYRKHIFTYYIEYWVNSSDENPLAMKIREGKECMARLLFSNSKTGLFSSEQFQIKRMSKRCIFRNHSIPMKRKKKVFFLNYCKSSKSLSFQPLQHNIQKGSSR